ncbi:MAG TPA: hypothetical protein VK879_09650 [Candidatus Sulfomarinibacteraceae bacterium]|nr:hypothetical protein [Candidatus Sulfomarinibacteraceae bacterium]
MMENVSVDAVFSVLQETMADDLIAAYQFPGYGGSYFSPIRRAANLLLVVRHNSLIHDLRTLFHQRCDHLSVDDLGIVMTVDDALRRHLHLNPLFARHLAVNGRRISGEPLALTDSAEIHPAEQVAFLAHHALLASAALAPARLPKPELSQALEQLRELATSMSEGRQFAEATVAELFATVQERLQQQIEALSLPQRQAAPVTDAGQTNLEAMYEDGEYLLVVIPPLVDRLLRRLDWDAVLQNAPEHLIALTVSTASQLQLAVQAERPLDYLLGNFQHLWGRDPIAGLRVSSWAVFRQAARKPSELLHGLSADYIRAGDDNAVHRVIHDYQNRLLNMRLEHELLHRTQGIERSSPDKELPRRDEPNDVRIDAISAHLEWWTAFYAEKMAATPASEKMAPQ